MANSITLTKSTYEVAATNMYDGTNGTFEVLALDAGEALDKVERGGIWAADDARLVCPKVSA